MNRRVRKKVRRRVAAAVWGRWNSSRDGRFRTFERGWTKNRWVPGFLMPRYSLDQMRRAGVAHLDGDTLIIHREGKAASYQELVEAKRQWAVMCGRLVVSPSGHEFVDGYEDQCPMVGEIVGHHPRSRHCDGRWVRQ